MLCKADMSRPLVEPDIRNAERSGAEQIKSVEYGRRLPDCRGVFFWLKHKKCDE